MADHSTNGRAWTRRTFIAAGTAGLTTLAAPALIRTAEARVPTPPLIEKRLGFVNLHTGEELAATYWQRGRYDRDALADIDHILRDWRTGDIKRIDRDLLDLLVDLHARTGSREPFHVISGYRSPETNAMLVNASNGGVAKRSYHVRAMAIDIRLPDVPLKTLQRTALRMRRGGVGYYPSSNFVHVDTGPVRRW